MPKAPARPAIWILLSKGLKPMQIIALGYKEGTVYSYNSMWPTVKMEVKEKLKKYKEMSVLISSTESAKEAVA